MFCTLAILISPAPNEWIHAKLLFLVFILIALIQAIAAIAGGEITVVSLPRDYRKLYERKIKWSIRILALLLFFLTVILGFINDRSLASADTENANLQNKVDGLNSGLQEQSTLIGVLSNKTSEMAGFYRNIGNRALQPKETQKAIIDLALIQQGLKGVTENLEGIAKRYNVPYSPSSTPQSGALPPTTQTPNRTSSVEPLDPQCPNPTSPMFDLNQAKPLKRMTNQELRGELNNCEMDLLAIKGKYSDFRSSSIHELMNSNPNPSPSEISRVAPQFENYNELDRQSYLSIRPAIIALRGEVLSRLHLSEPDRSRDSFNSLDKIASSPPPIPRTASELNTSDSFDQLARYLSMLDEKLSKIPRFTE